MIYEVKMYACKCNNCGSEAFDNSDYSCWPDPELVREQICEMSWHETDYKNPLTSLHYCDLCHSFDDEDGLIIDLTRKDLLNNPRQTAH